MLRKSIVTILVSFLLTVSSFAQTAGKPSENVLAKISAEKQTNFMKDKSEKIDFKKSETESLKSSAAKRKRLSKGAKIGIWTGVIVGAALLTGFIIWQNIKPKNCNIFNDNLVCQ
ncbi:MAG: hypothetical protein ACR2J3_10800 [Aridibacter sp.]